MRLEPELGQLAHPQLVQDLARLHVPEVVALGGLEVGEGQERALRQPRTEGHRLKGREDGVAAEQGEEPGQAGGRQHERLVLVLHLDSQRDQVASGPAHDLAQQVRVRLEPGQVVEPGVDRVVRLRAEDVAEAGMARLELARSELQWYVQLAGPGATRGQVDRPRQAVVVDPRRRGRGLERRLGGEALVGVAERETGPVGGRSPHDLLRSITDPVLHLEQVGEVVVDRKVELDPNWLAEVALELEPLVEPVTRRSAAGAGRRCSPRGPRAVGWSGRTRPSSSR